MSGRIAFNYNCDDGGEVEFVSYDCILVERFENKSLANYEDDGKTMNFVIDNETADKAGLTVGDRFNYTASIIKNITKLEGR